MKSNSHLDPLNLKNMRSGDSWEQMASNRKDLFQLVGTTQYMF